MAVKESDVMKLKRELKENGISGAYLFYGDELYLRDMYVSKIKAVIPEDDLMEFNLITLDGRTMNKAEAADAIESFPMMSEQKLVIIRDSGIFKKPKEDDVAFWNDTIKNLPDYCILLFIEDTVDKRSSVYKTISKTGNVTEFGYLKPFELTAWVQGEVLKAKKKMSKDVIEYFILVCQEGLINLDNELKKLFTFCEEEITITDVQRVVSKSLSVRVFELSDAIMEKENDKALKILTDLKTVKESAFTILYLLNSMYDKMLLAQLMTKEGATTQEIERKLSLPPFVVKKYTSASRKFNTEFLKKQVMRVPELDLSIKQGKITDWEALYSFVLDSLSLN